MGGLHCCVLLVVACFITVADQQSVSPQQLDQLVRQQYVRSEPYHVGHGLVTNHYFLSNLCMRHAQAKIACKSLGGNLAEINSDREYAFVKHFIQHKVAQLHKVHISGISPFTMSDPENFRSSLTLDVNAIIDDVIVNGAADPGSYYDNSTDSEFPLFIDFFPNRPRNVYNPPSCINLVKRGSSVIRMANDKCTDSGRYLCEVTVTRETH
ncbi:uncharacterized protein LOC106011439 [Aplysia californica]|uniref:Uncharacterized protein LOC106011439 n=1 Tax=Aplysia californica TaxID=6500 RepID=A0ABM0ZXL0_APLCA|nr:uncharacterized protein LOC106011439 [Aplysia californica]